MILHAGLAEGITKEARFDIFTEKDASDNPICNLKVEEVWPTTSKVIEPEPSVYSLLRGDSEEPRELWALMTRVGLSSDVAIYLPLEQDFLPIRTEVTNARLDQSINKRKITLVNEEDPHELAAFKDANGNVGYEITDLTCVQLGLSRLPYNTSLTVAAICPVLSATADFFFHLRRSHKERLLAKDITVSVYKLKTGYIGGNRILRPEDEDMNDRGTVQIPIHKHVVHRYGLKVRSTHDEPLYVSAFMFNMSDLSICTSSRA
jgi:hypothetical protein